MPKHTEFELANGGDEVLQADMRFPVSGQARVGDVVFTPPWAQ